MEDFVVRKVDTETFTNKYFGKDGKWVNSTEEATKLEWHEAEYIKNWHIKNDDSGLFELMLRKDSKILRITDRLRHI